MNDLRLVGFTTVNGYPAFINPECVVAVRAYGSADSEILLRNGIDVQVKMAPNEAAALLVLGRPAEREDNSWLHNL